MKTNEERPQGESKVSFNIADAIVIIIALAIVIAFSLRIYNIFGAEDDTQSVRVRFKVSAISSGTVLPESNDVLYSTVNDLACGYVEEYTVTDTKVPAYNEHGERVYATVPGKSDLNGTLVLNCIKTDGCFYLSDTLLLTVGNTITLYTNERELSFEIIGIEEITSAESPEATPAPAKAFN